MGLIFAILIMIIVAMVVAGLGVLASKSLDKKDQRKTKEMKKHRRSRKNLK